MRHSGLTLVCLCCHESDSVLYLTSQVVLSSFFLYILKDGNHYLFPFRLCWPGRFLHLNVIHGTKNMRIIFNYFLLKGKTDFIFTFSFLSR